jgi:hypothetical protein
VAKTNQWTTKKRKPTQFLQVFSVRADSLMSPQSMAENVHSSAEHNAATSLVCIGGPSRRDARQKLKGGGWFF